MSDPTLTRRRMAALAGAAAASLAGCTGILNDSSSTEEPTDSGSGGDGSGSGGSDGGGDDGSGNVNESGGGSDSGSGDATDGSGADGTEAIPLQSEPADSLSVSMVADGGGALYFEPQLVWMKPGGTVTWGLESGNHSVTAYHPDNDRPQRIPDDASPFDSDVLAESNPSFEHTFETPGVYDYYCRPHRANGMVGTVVVGTPDPSGQPGLTEPQDELLDAAGESIATLNERTRTLLDGAD